MSRFKSTNKELNISSSNSNYSVNNTLNYNKVHIKRLNSSILLNYKSLKINNKNNYSKLKKKLDNSFTLKLLIKKSRKNIKSNLKLLSHKTNKMKNSKLLRKNLLVNINTVNSNISSSLNNDKNYINKNDKKKFSKVSFFNCASKANIGYNNYDVLKKIDNNVLKLNTELLKNNNCLKKLATKSTLNDQIKLDEIMIEILLKNKRKEFEVNRIMQYLCTFDNLISFIKSAHNCYDDLLRNIAQKIKYNSQKKNNFLFRVGDYGDKFYIIFKGSVSIFILNEINLTINFYDYFYFISKLFLINEIHLFKLNIKKNMFTNHTYDDLFKLFCNLNIQDYEYIHNNYYKNVYNSYINLNYEQTLKIIDIFVLVKQDLENKFKLNKYCSSNTEDLLPCNNINKNIIDFVNYHYSKNNSSTSYILSRDNVFSEDNVKNSFNSKRKKELRDSSNLSMIKLNKNPTYTYFVDLNSNEYVEYVYPKITNTVINNFCEGSVFAKYIEKENEEILDSYKLSSTNNLEALKTEKKNSIQVISKNSNNNLLLNSNYKKEHLNSNLEASVSSSITLKTNHFSLFKDFIYNNSNNIKKINTVYLDNHNYDYSETKSINIIVLKKIKDLNSGDKFGELAITTNNNIRSASIRINENTEFGVLDSKSFKTSLQTIDDKLKVLHMNYLHNNKLFSKISKTYFKSIFEKLQIHKIHKGSKIIIQDQHFNSIIFIISGEYEINCFKSLNEIINLFKSISNKDDAFNKEIDKLKSYKNYKTYLTKKRYFKIGICSENSIIGMDDIVDHILKTSYFNVQSNIFVKKSEYYKIDKSLLLSMLSKDIKIKSTYKSLNKSKIKILCQKLESIIDLQFRSFHNDFRINKDTVNKPIKFDNFIANQYKLNNYVNKPNLILNDVSIKLNKKVKKSPLMDIQNLNYKKSDSIYNNIHNKNAYNLNNTVKNSMHLNKFFFKEYNKSSYDLLSIKSSHKKINYSSIQTVDEDFNKLQKTPINNNLLSSKHTINNNSLNYNLVSPKSCIKYETGKSNLDYFIDEHNKPIDFLAMDTFNRDFNTSIYYNFANLKKKKRSYDITHFTKSSKITNKINNSKKSKSNCNFSDIFILSNCNTPQTICNKTYNKDINKETKEKRIETINYLETIESVNNKYNNNFKKDISKIHSIMKNKKSFKKEIELYFPIISNNSIYKHTKEASKLESNLNLSKFNFILKNNKKVL